MDSLMSVSGLASGVQWRDMIDQIMRLERRPATLLEAQIARAESRSAAWSLFRGRLSVLQQAASRLASGAAFDGFNARLAGYAEGADRKSTRLNSSHVKISYAVFCLKKK